MKNWKQTVWPWFGVLATIALIIGIPVFVQWIGRPAPIAQPAAAPDDTNAIRVTGLQEEPPFVASHSSVYQDTVNRTGHGPLVASVSDGGWTLRAYSASMLPFASKEDLLRVLSELPPGAVAMVGYAGRDGAFHILSEADLRPVVIDSVTGRAWPTSAGSAGEATILECGAGADTTIPAEPSEP